MRDNKLQYHYSFDKIFYDIEVVSQNDQFPYTSNEQAFVVSIQFKHNDEFNFWTLSIYQNQFNEYSNIKYQYFKNSQTLCQQFILYLNNLKKYTLVIGYNSSQDFSSND